MNSRQENARMLLRDASRRMMEAEYAEAEAVARLHMVTEETTVAQIDELIAEVNLAYAARVQAQLHYANCRLELRAAWDERGNEQC